MLTCLVRPVDTGISEPRARGPSCRAQASIAWRACSALGLCGTRLLERVPAADRVTAQYGETSRRVRPCHLGHGTSLRPPGTQNACVCHCAKVLPGHALTMGGVISKAHPPRTAVAFALSAWMERLEQT